MKDDDVIILTDSEGKRYRVTEEIFFANTECFSIDLLQMIKDKPEWLVRYLNNFQCSQ